MLGWPCDDGCCCVPGEEENAFAVANGPAPPSPPPPPKGEDEKEAEASFVEPHEAAPACCCCCCCCRAFMDSSSNETFNELLAAVAFHDDIFLQNFYPRSLYSEEAIASSTEKDQQMSSEVEKQCRAARKAFARGDRDTTQLER